MNFECVIAFLLPSCSHSKCKQSYETILRAESSKVPGTNLVRTRYWSSAVFELVSFTVHVMYSEALLSPDILQRSRFPVASLFFTVLFRVPITAQCVCSVEDLFRRLVPMAYVRREVVSITSSYTRSGKTVKRNVVYRTNREGLGT